MITVRSRLARGLGWLLASVAPLAAQVTETPFTMAPGSFLLRMDAITVGVNRDAAQPQAYTALGLASAMLSAGITREVDVQVGMQFFLRQTFQFRGARDSNSGRGDTTVRLKWTFWQDAGTGAAAAVIPYVKLPSNTGGVGNNRVEGGFIVPWAWSLGRGSRLGAMGQWDMQRNTANDGYQSRWFVSGFAHQDLFGGFGAYAESTFALTSAGFSTFAGGLGGGVTYDLSEHLRFDYGISRGLGNRATDWTHVLRVNWQF